MYSPLPMQLDAYLRRIDYTGPVSVNLATLTALHRQHLRAIPYENLDVQLGRGITLDAERIFDKIVTRKRGGWCYEMNGLLVWALREIGFSVTELAAGVMREERGDEALGNHLALLVHLERDYLADAGFGDGLLEPIALEEHEIEQGPLRFRLQKLDERFWRFLNHPQGGARSFDFSLAPADRDLLSSQCAWLQSAPDSPFVLNAVCQIHTADGLIMMRGRSVKVVNQDGVSQRNVTDAADYRSMLKNVFRLDVPEVDYLWERILERDARRTMAAPP